MEYFVEIKFESGNTFKFLIRDGETSLIAMKMLGETLVEEKPVKIEVYECRGPGKILCDKLVAEIAVKEY